jgi:thioredoxin-dependent peroxiredoxin
MAVITDKGRTIHTSGSLPAKGTIVPDFRLVGSNFEEVGLDAWKGMKKVVSVFLSVDTSVCRAGIRSFNLHASELPGVVVLNVSGDLPFAQSRFCAAEGLKNVVVLSSYRSTFAKDWGLQMVDGPFAGLCSRAVIVLDEQNRVLYTEQVPELGQEPNYQAAIAKLS